MVESIIALGTNLGDRAGNLRRAIGMIGGKMNLVEVSSVYETKPMYYEEQDWFLNCVVAVETDLKPGGLLRELQAMETELGRKRTVRYGPRVIDLDILFYGNEVVSEPGLEIPHPKIAERHFVLVPLNEIRPELVHPVLGRRTSELLGNLEPGWDQVIKRPRLLSDFVSSSPQRS
jgi:2-amino-4-hydroxy-6-hydroxymethyldihydropteridine diphosphokinase